MEDTWTIDRHAVRWSTEPSGDRPLLVLLHGRGSDEADLFGLVPYLPSDPVVASVRAPIPEGPGYSWYRMNPAAGDAGPRTGVEAATTALFDWIDSLAPVTSIGLLGFSQGGAIALQLLRRRPGAFSYVVQLSGFLVEGDEPNDEALAVLRPPVFWGRGSLDPVIPEAFVERTSTWLEAHSTLEARLYEEGHSINELELADVASFIGSHLGRG